MTLMDYPTTPNADPLRPAPADAQYFREAVLAFQPSDYDALIEERNIADKCGYALCSRPKKRARSTAKKQFVDTEHGVEIVDRKVLEVWCSDDCAKRALYVKVQLDQEPVWMRQGGYGDQIELMVENAEEHDKSLQLQGNKELEKGKKATSEGLDDEDEAMEEAWAARHEAVETMATGNNLVQDQIKEHTHSHAPPQPPSLPLQETGHTMAIEGHVPRIDRKDRDEDEDEDEDDQQDWDKHLPS
ncbi:Rtr1/RPAP2 family-domain-containing protein [Phaeosphaeriaceae sp. PMI808]|nr:Rtr1/RPAP2 family-domain-containing protein [Phaeosphaeriaceae sp. PMI808]